MSWGHEGSPAKYVTIAALNNLDSVIDKHQTCVFLTICDSPTDVISDCLNVDSVRKRFVVTSFFLVTAVAYSWWFFGFSGVTIVKSLYVS